MTTYEITLSQQTDVNSLLVNASGNCIINNIIFDAQGMESLPCNEIAYPIIVSAGKQLLTLTKPIQATRIELIGSGLEFIRGVSVNDSTLAEELQEQINNIVANTVAYVHTQSVPSDTWTINHTLPYKPNVTIVDSAGSVVHGNVDYVGDSQVVVTFSGGFSGKAYLS